MWGIELAIMAGMIAVNSLFAGYEIALASISFSRLQVLVRENRIGARAALYMKENMEGKAWLDWRLPAFPRHFFSGMFVVSFRQAWPVIPVTKTDKAAFLPPERFGGAVVTRCYFCPSVMSGRLDSNQRPPEPHSGALAKLRHAPVRAL